MSDSLKQNVENLTPHGQRLLDILRDNGAWMTRSDIALVLDRKKLNVWDTAMLDKLATWGFIEAEKRAEHGITGYTWVYKAVTDTQSSGN